MTEAASLTVPNTRQGIGPLKIARPFAEVSALRQGIQQKYSPACRRNQRRSDEPSAWFFQDLSGTLKPFSIP